MLNFLKTKKGILSYFKKTSDENKKFKRYIELVSFESAMKRLGGEVVTVADATL